MAVKLHNHHSFVSSSSSNPWISRNSVKSRICCRRVAALDYLFSNCENSRKKYRLARLENGGNNQPVSYRKSFGNPCKPRRIGYLLPHASSDDGVTVNGSPQASTSSGVEEMRVKLNISLKGNDCNDGLVQSLHDAARVFELAIKEKDSLSKLSWLSTAWLGADRNAWIKSLSYQASIYSLLQAAYEISSCDDGRDRDTYVFVQRSLLRQSAPLESLIRERLSAKQLEAYEWFWSEQVPAVVTSFINYFKGDQRFTAATAMYEKGMPLGSGSASDTSLIKLALICISAITKLGPAKVACPQFSSMIPEITGRLMDMLVDMVSISQAYYSIKDIGLHREFLVHFGPRASACRVKNDRDSEEVVFWVDLVQKQLQRAIDREKIWSRLTTSESIEVLERDLAIFGFFIALGRSTQSFLCRNGYNVVDDPLGSFIRYLIGGSVLYYPQLSSISSYQLYVEVVSEELDWLLFYPGSSGMPKQSHSHKSKQGPPNADAIPQVLDICSHWMQSFIKYSTWLENSSNVKAAKFLSRGHKKLMDCMKERGYSNGMIETAESLTYSPTEIESDTFDKALESVEEALIRLEKLFQELHVSSSTSGKEQLKAACSDLEKMRKLKKEAEFLEASFRAKAASLQQGGDDSDSGSAIGEKRQYLKGTERRVADVVQDRPNEVVSKSRGLFGFLTLPPTRKLKIKEDEYSEMRESNIGVAKSESNEILRFELLRNELIELERRVQRSADQSDNEDIMIANERANRSDKSRGTQLVQIQKSQNIIGKSLEKLKETSTDVWQGTQLLAIDVGAAMELLRRAMVGDELTQKEKQALQRTVTDLASVVPIGVLMLLPVTAVGHAAMLAAIQRYVPGLIPSTYGPERLDLLRQLEKVKEMEANEVDPDENVSEAA